jgi:error-prone DNA polymerase
VSDVLPPYAELHCRSNFSFLVGASHPEELVARAHALGYAALAITDECSLSGIVRAHAEAERLGLRLLVGSEMRLSPPEGAESGDEPHLVLLAQSRRGYGNLSHWITVARRRADKGQYRAWRHDVEGRVATAPMLAGLPDCFALLVPDAAQPLETVFAHALWLKTWFGPERAAIVLELLHHADDAELADTVSRVAAHTGLPVVAAGGVLMHARSRKPLLDVLTATRLKRPVADCGFELEPNAEAHLRSRQRLAALYRPEWLDATLAVAGRCAFSLNELK